MQANEMYTTTINEVPSIRLEETDIIFLRCTHRRHLADADA